MHTNPHPPHRHCERSEAISLSGKPGDCNAPLAITALEWEIRRIGVPAEAADAH
jgi:hypothetical protein